MKSLKIIFILSLIVSFHSCEDVLDKRPLDKVSDADVWNDVTMIQAYVVNLYSRIPFSAFAIGGWHNYCDEATTSTGNTNALTQGNMSRTNDAEAYWDYGYIRACCMFLEKIANTPIQDAVKKQLEGEVRFIRAYIYYQKMIRYGGVPLVDVVLDPFSTVDPKYTHRATEEAIANFIDSELTVAINLLSDNPTPTGRVNKWTAYALQARSNLWAATIAKYGTVQLEGLVGIPATKAAQFYEKASTAAEMVINSGKYILYNENSTDKSENYRNLFLDEGAGNKEIIFERVFDNINITHSWDLWQMPPQFAGGRGASDDPTLEFIEGFENADGSSDQPNYGIDYLYDDGFAPFQKKDPRLLAMVFFQGDKWGSGTVQTYEGLDPSVTPDPSAIISNHAASYNGIRTVGVDSRMIEKDDLSTNSGFIIKKYCNEKHILSSISGTNWVMFRLAEMYLIKAEAEFELGNKRAAADALNETRKRAGIMEVDEITITLEKVRTERRSELAFEQHRFWDLRRWRIAHTELNGKRFQGLRIIYHYESGKYYFLPFNCETFSRIFREQHYYNPITNGRIDNNPHLIENPLY